MILLSANAFNLGQSKNLLFGKELNLKVMQFMTGLTIQFNFHKLCFFSADLCRKSAYCDPTGQNQLELSLNVT